MKSFLAWSGAVVVVVLGYLLALYEWYQEDLALASIEEGSSRSHSLPSNLALERTRLDAAGVQALNVTTEFRQTVLFKKGAKEGLPLVVMLHGFPDNAGTFYAQFDAIAEAGYDVIAPVLRGYEPSTSGLPRSSYTLDKIAGDVLAIIELEEAADNRRPPGKVHMIGHDWGAVLGYVMASKMPGLFLSLTTMAVPHDMVAGIKHYPRQVLNSWYIFFFQLPSLPELFLGKGIPLLWRLWSPRGWTPDPAYIQSVLDTFDQPGVARSALAYYRVNTLQHMLKLFQRPPSPEHCTEGDNKPDGGDDEDFMTSTIAVPTLALTGAEDGCIDSRIYDVSMGKELAAKRFPLGLEVVRLQGAGHFLHQELPTEVNRYLVSWLNRWTARLHG